MSLPAGGAAVYAPRCAMPPCEVPPEAHTFLYAFRKLLLVLHFAGAVVLAGSSTHLALQMPALLRGASRVRLERVYGRVVAASFALTYALGALLYPTYRYHVRALFLDRHHPMVANVFDVKENLATIALPLALAHGALGGSPGTRAGSVRARSSARRAGPSPWNVIRRSTAISARTPKRRNPPVGPAADAGPAGIRTRSTCAPSS